MIPGLVALAALATAPTTRQVSWQDVRGKIAETICAIPSDRRPPDYVTVFGDRERCGLSKATTPLERAIDTGFENARPLLVTVPSAYEVFPGDLEKRYEGASPDERNRIAREALLTRQEFLGPLVPSVVAAMADENMACKDCPAFEPPSMRTATWDEFFPYWDGFISPDPVRTPLGPDGTPSGQPRYSFHICGGLDPGSSMDRPDRALLRAGFLAAFASPALRDRIGEHFGAILSEKAFKDLTNDEARTSYLRGRLKDELYGDASVRRSVCDVLEAYVATLGVRIQDCSKRPAAGEPERLDLLWSIEGHWTGVAVDTATDSIYALAERGACAEIDASGKIERTFSLSGADGDILRLARFKDRSRPALLTFHIWAPQVKANDGDGNPLWSYPQGDRSGIDDVERADLDADGSDEIIVGFNATQGVHVVDRNGKLVWKSGAPKGAWGVDAGEVTAAGRTAVVAANGEVHVSGDHGVGGFDLDPGCYAGGPVRVVGGPDDARGARIVVACAPSGRKEIVKGLSVDGAIRWTLELPEDAQPAAESASVAPDRPWIAIGTAGGEVYVVDVGTGAILAAARDLGHAPQVAWLPGEGAQPPRLLVAAGRALSQFRVVPHGPDSAPTKPASR